MRVRDAIKLIEADGWLFSEHKGVTGNSSTIQTRPRDDCRQSLI